MTYLAVELLISRASSLSAKFQQGRETNYIDEAIDLDREALELCPLGHGMRSVPLTCLAIHLGDRYDQLGAIQDLDEAIVLNREVLDLCPQGHPDWSKSSNKLAVRLSTRYDQLGAIRDLDEAIVLNREVLDLRPQGHIGRSKSLNKLAVRLSTRYKQLGAMQDLDEAIVLNREVLNLRPQGHPDRSKTLNKLAFRLSTRYDELGEMHDLDETIVLGREALSLRPQGHPDRSRSLKNLAAYLSKRHRQLREMQDLDEAILLDREALDLRPQGHPDRAMSLGNLADGLSARYDLLGAMQDLNEAISLGQEALNLCPQGHPDREMSLSNLALHLSIRHKQLGAMQDLDKAIVLSQEALGIFPPGNPRRSRSLHYLTSRLHTRFMQLRKVEDREELFSLYAELESAPCLVYPDDLSTAEAWVNTAEDLQHPTTLLAYETSLRFLIQHLVTLPSSPQHLVALKKLAWSLSVDVFSACLRKPAPTLAIELLELGLGIFWNRLTHLHSPLDDVIVFRLAGKTLADEFTRLISLLHTALSSLDPEQHNQARHFNIQLQKVLGDIRHLPGLSRFLLPPLFLDVQLVATDGPVIVVNASKCSCDALIILLEHDPIHISLKITAARVRELTSNLRALTLRTDRVNMTSDLVVILRELWDRVVSPIIKLLPTKHPSRSRIWWCPMAEFSRLPLHAAGPCRIDQHNLDDLYISSYTTTLTALIRARPRYPSSSVTERKRFLAIGQAPATSGSQNVSVSIQLASIARCLEDITTFTRLEGPECSVSRVSEEFNKNQWVHISCHGLLDPKQPFDSAFVLRDGHFAIKRIIQCNLQDPQFAYLSGRLATVGDESPESDEVIHLASLMQLAGFRSVVGTMWDADDAYTAQIASVFYQNMIDESGRLDHTCAAFALHKTMKTLVDIPLDQRILYVHFGA